MRDKEKQRAYNRAYYLAHREELIEAHRQWGADNPAQKKEIARRSRYRTTSRNRRLADLREHHSAAHFVQIVR